jgi:hypothetical protein
LTPSIDRATVPPSKPVSNWRRCPKESRVVLLPTGTAMPVAPLGWAKLKLLLL